MSTAEITVDVDGTEVIIPDVYGREPYDDVLVGPVREDGSRTVAWLVHDESCDIEDPLDDEGITWDSFRRGDPDRFDGDIDAVNQHLKDNEGRAFLVECYQHGLVSYSLVDEGRFYPDRQWDVGVAGIITLSEDFTDPRAAAVAIMESYTAWCNGDVYGVCERTIAADGTVAESGEECWGFIGHDYAVTEVRFAAGFPTE